MPLDFQPVHIPIAGVGEELVLNLAVKNSAQWAGRLRYRLDPGDPAGAAIDPQTGSFSWTPTPEQAGTSNSFTASVRAPDGRGSFLGMCVRVGPLPPPSPPDGNGLTVPLGNGVALEMVLIPAGGLMMGSPDSDTKAQRLERPQHRVRITKPFYLGKYLVTQEEWEAVMGSMASGFDGPRNPVEQVGWDDCQQFLEKLSEKLARGKGRFVLPTEAQWEYACRAGSADEVLLWR